MLREWWNKLAGREAVEREIEREHESPAERHFQSQSIEDYQADVSSEEHLGGFDPLELEDDGPREDLTS